MNKTNQRVTASLKSLFIGDALSMPVHWFYRASDIIRYFPPHGIERMEAAPPNHPSSIMSLHSKDSGGRRKTASRKKTALTGQVVGDIILKGRAEHWGGQQTHYHHGMQAGDNTLNACCARLMMRHLVEQGGYDQTLWLDSYIEFMTADSAMHPDTYAESYHRSFFANFKAGMDPHKCGEATHDTPSMGALVTVAPLALALFKSHTLEEAQSVCCQHVQLTHPDRSLMVVVCAYVSILFDFLNIDIASDAIVTPGIVIQQFAKAANAVPGVKLEQLLMKNTADAAVVGGMFSTACYISDSWPSVCFLAAKYFESPGRALLVNTNLGGENAHRGSVLGTLVSLTQGSYDLALFDQLLHRDAIEKEVQQLTDNFLG